MVDKGDGERAVQIWTEAVWRARVPGSPDIVESVSLDQIQRGLESGKLDEGGEIAHKGTELWTLASDHVKATLDKYGSLSDADWGRTKPRKLPPAVELSAAEPRPKKAPVPPPAVPPPRPPPRRLSKLQRTVKRLRGQLGLTIALAVSVLILLAAVVTMFVVLVSHLTEDEMTLPVVAEKLPGRTVQVLESPLRSDLNEMAKLPEAFVASSLAGVACGGVDVGLQLALARGKDFKELHRLGILGMLTSQQVTEALDCGVALAKALQSPSVVSIHFTDGDVVRRVSLIRATLTDFPAKSFQRNNFSGLPGFCQVDEEKKADCKQAGRAAFRDGQLWILGDLSSVESFARAYTTAREELTTNVEILTQLVPHMTRADHSMLVARPETVPWTAPCSMVAPVGKNDEFVKACFPDGQKRVLESIETKLRGLAVQRDMLGRAEAFRWEYILLARDDEAATGIEKDLADLTRDWRAHLENTEPQLVRLVQADSPYAHDRFWQAALDPFLRALRKPEVERSGPVVKLVFYQELREAEAKLIKEFAATRTSDQEATIKVVEALINDAPVPEESLAVFVGTDVAKWLLAPRATKQDCAALREKLDKLGEGELTPAQFGLKFKLGTRLEDELCVGRVLPPDVKKCHLDAASLEAFGQCKGAASPFAAVVRDKLVGKWRIKDVEFAPGAPIDPARRKALSECRLEFTKQSVVVVVGAEKQEGTHDVDAGSFESAEVRVRREKKTLRWSVTFVDDDKLKITSFVDGVREATFVRASAANPLAGKPDGESPP